MLGKSDFKALLKWRLAIRAAVRGRSAPPCSHRQLGLVQAVEEPEVVETAEVVEMDEDEQGGGPQGVQCANQ